jgi:hypothetical protein
MGGYARLALWLDHMLLVSIRRLDECSPYVGGNGDGLAR